MNDALSLWRSPLDRVALTEAKALSKRQPCCSIGPGEDFSQMTVYNFGHYAAEFPNDSAEALDAMFAAMAPRSGLGGVAFIPQKGYIISEDTYLPLSVPDQSNVLASGTGGSHGPAFYHFAIQNSGSSGLTFLKCSGGAYTTGGTYFQWLAFRWENSKYTSDTCILAATGSCCAIRSTFTDCPCAFYAQAPGCALKQCTIDYESGPDGATAVVIAASQCAILGPGEFFQVAPNPSGGGPASCTGISVQGGADHTVVADLHISDWTTGVDFSEPGGSTNTHIRNCEIQSYVIALNIVVGSDGAPISGVKATSTLLMRTNYSGDSDNASPVVLIDPGGFGNDHLSDITLSGCTVYNMGNAASLTGQHGLEIVGGANIKVIGGTYSNNSPSGGAGIAITGACGDVQIIGANLQPSYDDGTGQSTTQNQQFGLFVTSNPQGTVLVSGCDMRGYTAPGSAAASASGVTKGLYICNCLGYNEQNTPLNGLIAPTSLTNAATCSTPYFGPSVITFWNASPVTLNVFGQSLTLSFGVVFLPSPYDYFSFSTSSPPPTGFSWFGK